MSTNGMVKFACLINLKNKEEGGRHTPISSGFRTDMKFNDEFRMVVIEFDQEWLFPGQEVQGNITALLHGDDEIEKVLENKTSIIADGANEIGKIEVISVLDRGNVEWD